MKEKLKFSTSVNTPNRDGVLLFNRNNIEGINKFVVNCNPFHEFIFGTNIESEAILVYNNALKVISMMIERGKYKIIE